MVAFGLSSLRGTAMNFHIFSHVLKNGLPCWTVIQNWILRFGLYKLKQALPKRDDWVYIMDHTVEFGTQQCLVVLAVSLEAFRKKKCQLKHQDMEVAAIKVGNCSTGKEISGVLEEIAAESGVPVQIVSDAAPNLKSGIKLFNEAAALENPEYRPVKTYDITHKGANILKRLLNDNAEWNSFNKRLGETKTRVVQTEFVAYASNKAKTKARWLNLDAHVAWANNILRHEHKQGQKSEKEQEWQDKFDGYYGWVAEYKNAINEWSACLEVIKMANIEVKENGLSKKTHTRFKKRLNIKRKHKLALGIKAELVEFFKEESKDLPDSGAWLGTSDIIESIFGKYKLFSAKTPIKEVGKTILTIPVFTSKITASEVKAAMESISAKEVQKWINGNLGESLFSKRNKIFSPQKQKSA